MLAMGYRNNNGKQPLNKIAVPQATIARSPRRSIPRILWVFGLLGIIGFIRYLAIVLAGRFHWF